MPAAPQPMPPVSTTALYCAVQFGKTLLRLAADLVACYVLNVVGHVPTGDVAMILMGSLAWHVVSDVLVGHWLEQRTGDRRSLALLTGAAVPLASVAFVVTLSMAASWPLAALAMMMACRTARLSGCQDHWRSQSVGTTGVARARLGASPDAWSDHDCGRA